MPVKKGSKLPKAKPGDKRLGNNFWELRSKHGRDTIFETPEIMWEAACEYFQWCVKNPIQDPRSFGQRKVQRPFTKEGLCRYLHVNTRYFIDFKKAIQEKDEKGFSAIITLIEDVIYQHKYENAVIGVYKDNIIARDLGLVEKVDATTKGEKINSSPIILLPAEKLTDEQIEKFMSSGVSDNESV